MSPLETALNGIIQGSPSASSTQSLDRSPAILETKSHYEILDGLRGVAAIMVVIFHTFESFSFKTYPDGNSFVLLVNHGYMAVDFFFLLSGFVVAYAYDDRWGRMTQWDFYKRRLIRLQPMVVAGSLVGAALFYFQRAPVFPLISTTPGWKVLLVMLVGATLIPLPPSLDIRGWQEMQPLDGPAWSLFFEYIANILYALGLRKLSNKALAVLVFAAACFLIQLTVFGPRGDVVGGWSIDHTQLHIGFARLLYPFMAGMLLMRLGRRIHVRHAFFVCSFLVVASLAMPRFGGPQHLWRNGLYEAFCIIIVFPVIVALGAGGTIKGPFALRLCRFLGAISYPLYITHYALIYVYIGWVTRNKVSAAYGTVAGALLLFTSVLLAWLLLKFYDEPVRAWLTRRFLVPAKKPQYVAR